MRILIGHDGSECSAAAIADLRRAGLPADADATVLSVADAWVLPPSPELMSPGSLALIRQQEDAALEAARKTAAAAADRVAGMFPHWKVRFDARADSPYWALIKSGHEWAADLLSGHTGGPPSAG